MSVESKTAVARGFVHSLNILLKFARLYEFGHARTSAQFETAWKELRSALKVSGEAGLLLGASGTQLHIDGVPLESAAAERSFARLLSNAGVASIHFAANCTQASLAKFVRAFPTGSGGTTSAKALVDQLRAALEGDTGIKINEVRFVREDAANAGHKIVATLTSKALGGGEGQFKDWLNDPQKLLQLIIAAEGSRGRSGPGGGPSGGGPGGGGPGGGSGQGFGGGGPGGGGTGGSGWGGGSGGTGGGGAGGGTGWGGGPGGGGVGGPAVVEGSGGGGWDNVGGTGGRGGPGGGTPGSGGGPGGTWSGGSGGGGSGGLGVVGGAGGLEGGGGTGGDAPGSALGPSGSWSGGSGSSGPGSGPGGGGPGGSGWGGGPGGGGAGGADSTGPTEGFLRGGSGGSGSGTGGSVGGAGGPGWVGGSAGGSGGVSSSTGGGGEFLSGGPGGSGSGVGGGGGAAGGPGWGGVPGGGGPAGGGTRAGAGGSWAGGGGGTPGGTGQSGGGPSAPSGGWLTGGATGSGSGGGGGQAGAGDWNGGTGGVGSGGSGEVAGPGGSSATTLEQDVATESGKLKPKRLRPSMWGTAAAVGLSVGLPGAPGRTGSGGGSEPAGRGGGGEFGAWGPGEEEVRGILGLLAQLGKSSQEAGGNPEPVAFQQRLSTLPTRSQFTLQQALAGLAAQAPSDTADQPMLLKLAEHVAIRFALDSYERGEVRVDAVREMLDSMGKEIESLRKILGAHEEKLSRAGLEYQSHVDQLAQQFWAEIPAEGKLSALLSADAWCVPPRNARQFIDELLNQGDEKTANQILLHYASCISQDSADARRSTAMGLAELADLYSTGEAQQLVGAIKDVGVRLCIEDETELQSLVSAAFVRLVQEAGTQRSYPAMLQALDSIDAVGKVRPTFGQALRPRIGVEDRLPEFIEEALRSETIHPGLGQLMCRMPLAAADQLSVRFSRSGFRDDCDLLIQAAGLLGETGIEHLRETLRTGPSTQAVDTVGLLSRLDVHALQEWLPGRMKEWQRTFQDRVVRQLAAGGAKERCLLLLGLFEILDPYVKPLVIDEIGMSADPSSIPFLRRLAESEVKEGSAAYLRLKAIEALGRLADTESVPLLRKIVETRQMFRWTYPTELRVVAAQVLIKLDPDWTRAFLPKSGLMAAELDMALPDIEPMSHCIRQRRYPRLKLSRPLPAVTTNLRDNYRMEVQVMNLGGGVASCDRYLTPGTLVALKFSPSLRPLRAQAFVRDARSQNMGFEIVDMDLEERYRLRKLLVELGGAPVPASAKSRSRRRGRATAATKRAAKSEQPPSTKPS